MAFPLSLISENLIDGLIALSPAMLDRDHPKEGRNLERLGLPGKSAFWPRSVD